LKGDDGLSKGPGGVGASALKRRAKVLRKDTLQRRGGRKSTRRTAVNDTEGKDGSGLQREGKIEETSNLHITAQAYEAPASTILGRRIGGHPRQIREKTLGGRVTCDSQLVLTRNCLSWVVGRGR